MASSAEGRQVLRPAGWNKPEKRDRWRWRAARQGWAAGAKLEPLGAAQVAVARRMLTSRFQEAVGRLSRQGDDSI